MTKEFDKAALEYHRKPVPGKLEIKATKKMVNQRDLSLAYSPGVAGACKAIVNEPAKVSQLTVKGNLVGVVTNGTAVLGLGTIGPVAAKPVMEGKAILFKKFANVDVFDLEVNETDPEKFVEIVAALEPTFGGINLEDIKAPECFLIEEKLKERMNIPVFHDDQHGTAICVAAAIRNGLRISKKKLKDVKLVCSGAGAAALACLNLLVSMGLKRERITVCDIEGVVYRGREALMDEYKAQYAVETDARTLGDVIADADIFLGLSAPGVLKSEFVEKMADRPFILALANPDPEIRPEEVHAVRSDALIATGRSDYSNQVNNVLCFPFLFRAALDVGATQINDEMKIACVEAIADIATMEVSDVVSRAYGGSESLQFGAEYLIPKPFDPRLMTDIPPRVAKAAMDSGVATKPIDDFHAYRRKLRQFVFESGLVMKPVFERAMSDPQRVVFAEGESRRILSAVQEMVDEGICVPTLIGNPGLINERISELGLRIRPEEDFRIVDPMNNPNFVRDWQTYHEIMGRKGVTPSFARTVVTSRKTALAALMVRQSDVDAMICGAESAYMLHLPFIKTIIGIREYLDDCAAITMLILPSGTFFITDTHVSENPSARQIATNTIMAAEVVKNFGLIPKAALLSHSNFGSWDSKQARKMQKARNILRKEYPHLAVEGEMHADAALSDEIRNRTFPNSRFEGQANLLIMPGLSAANISYNMVKVLGDAVPVGPMLIGTNQSAHILSNSATVRTIVNMTAIAVVDAQVRKKRKAEKASSSG